MTSARFFFRAAAAALVLSPAVWLTPVGAQTTFNNAAAFNAASSTNIIQNFENIAPSGGISGTNPSVAPISIIVSGGNNYAVVDSDSVFGSINGTDSLYTALSSSGSPTITFVVNQQTTAFGLEFLFADEGGAVSSTVNGQLLNGNTAVGSAFTSSAQNGFLGVTSTTPFDRVSITLNPGNGNMQLYDNVRVGAAAPEPGSIALAFSVAPVAAMAAVRRRRRRK